MAISLYDRCVDGDSMISDDGCRINRVAARAIRDILAVAEVDGPVDLRDLSTVIKGSVDDVILNEIITRRLTVKKNRGDRNQDPPREWSGHDLLGLPTAPFNVNKI